MSMPGDNFGDNKFLWGTALTNALSSNQIPMSRVDDMVTRILAAWYLVGQDTNYPKVTGWTSWNGGKGGPNVQGDHKTLARKMARDGIVLLKNADGATPCLAFAIVIIVCCAQISNAALHRCCCCNSTLAWVCGADTTSHI